MLRYPRRREVARPFTAWLYMSSLGHKVGKYRSGMRPLSMGAFRRGPQQGPFLLSVYHAIEHSTCNVQQLALSTRLSPYKPKLLVQNGYAGTALLFRRRSPIMFIVTTFQRDSVDILAHETDHQHSGFFIHVNLTLNEQRQTLKFSKANKVGIVAQAV